MKYNLYILKHAYPALYICYKLLLTLSVTQVSCEHDFSKLKFVKSHILTSALLQDHLKSFMLVSIEKILLNGVDSDEMIDKVACKSKML